MRQIHFTGYNHDLRNFSMDMLLYVEVGFRLKTAMQSIDDLIVGTD